MLRLLYFVSLCFLLQNCVKNNPLPSYLEINEWTLIDNFEVEEGELTHNFKHAFITIDNNFIGFVTLPIKLPLLEFGTKNIKITPVIENNGISATKKEYPFCKAFEFTANLVSNEVITVNPVTSYYSNTEIWIEDFENTVFKLDDSEPISSAKIVKENLPAILKYGNFYGHVTLNETQNYWSAVSSPAMTLPKSGAEVYLEIDFMNTNSVLTGVNAISSTDKRDNPNIQLNPQEESSMKWKKIYIELKEIVSSSIAYSSFEHYFKSILDNGKTTSNVYLDNIKVVHFK